MTKEAVIESIAAIQDRTNEDVHAVKIRQFIENGEGEISEEHFYALAHGLDLQDAGNMLLVARKAETLWDFIDGTARYLATRTEYASRQ